MTPAARNPDHTPFHPKWYRRRMPIFWWLGHFAYVKFIVRELTSVAVAYAALLLLAQFWILAQGPEAYARFVAWLQAPRVLALHGGVLVGLVLHTLTWLNLAPKALVVRLGSKRVPDGAIVAGHYAAWIITSALLAWALLGR